MTFVCLHPVRVADWEKSIFLPCSRGLPLCRGKVNPVIPEVMNQISYKVIGNDLCVAMSGEAAQMELNAMEPVMAQCCFGSADLLMNGFDTLRTLLYRRYYR